MKNLTKTAIILLEYIKLQSLSGNPIILSNKHLQRELGYTVKTIVTNLQLLEKENYIELEYENPRLRKIYLK